MAETTPGISIRQLIFVPSLITLGITILRLIGELRHWPRPWFSAAAGGGGAIIGVVWLPIIFGPYFALKLAGAGQRPKSPGKAIGFAVLSLIVLFAGSFVGFAPKLAFPGKLAVGYLMMVAAIALQFNPWPALARTLIAYAYAARIPIAVIMFFAIRANWGTHYDAPPPGYPSGVSFGTKYLQIAALPQLIFWVAFTVVIGALFGTVVAAIARRGKPATQTAT